MWALLSAIGAFFQSITGALNKKNLQVSKSAINIIAFINYSVAGMLLFILLFFLTGKPVPDMGNVYNFWKGILLAVPFSVVAASLGYRALRIAEYNYISPWLALTSLIIIIPSFLFLGETPSLMGTVGIAVVVAGAVIMDYRKKKTDYTEEEKEIVRNNRKAKIYILIVGICFSISPIGMRIAVLESSGLFAAAVVHISMALIFLFLLVLNDRQKIISIFDNMKKRDKKTFAATALSAGLSMAMANGSVFVAIGMAQAPLVIGIKRIAPVFSFFIGYIFFKEKSNARKKLLATLLMAAGAILITIFR